MALVIRATRGILATFLACFLAQIITCEEVLIGKAELEELRPQNGLEKLEDKLGVLENDLRLASCAKSFPRVKFRMYTDRKRVLVTGGAGFVGSHLVDRLMQDGHEVIVVDNVYTGRRRNVQHWIGHENFQLVTHDIVNPLYMEVEEIYHLASPASPPHYMSNPIKTLKTNALGTLNILGLAKRVKAKVLLASTSEVYGDPEVHPQPETYWGNVNPVGPRSCYDEGKRIAEAFARSYHEYEGVDVRIARIFNTYGPRMHMNDGRVVSNFVTQALSGQPLTVYGDGTQTRSFQYVSDLVDGLLALMNSSYTMPVNLGNPEERTVMDFARIVLGMTGSKSTIVHKPSVEDDPQKRRPVIELAKQVLGWKPKPPVEQVEELTRRNIERILRRMTDVKSILTVVLRPDFQVLMSGGMVWEKVFPFFGNFISVFIFLVSTFIRIKVINPYPSKIADNGVDRDKELYRGRVSIEEGLAETVQFFKEELDRSKDPRDHAYYPLESEQVKDSFHRADEL
ncbi:unnamed protein product [Notodromas monacha]|uniref:UDP-glucuronic acid decarboxylase 1 n=1 Tax=Notodromas monacha TaxID=399045 RepID=A0A7R9GE83_9CRUS|nr:unnamed protein product [Notodromas monacha]CAG0919344.1 unnamed protein product [Notodromas monacha]